MQLLTIFASVAAMFTLAMAVPVAPEDCEESSTPSWPSNAPSTSSYPPFQPSETPDCEESATPSWSTYVPSTSSYPPFQPSETPKPHSHKPHKTHKKTHKHKAHKDTNVGNACSENQKQACCSDTSCLLDICKC